MSATSSRPPRPVVQAGSLLFLSALRAPEPRDQDVASQTRAVLARARELLAGAGSGFDRVVSVIVYLTDRGHFQAMNGAYREFFTGEAPTRTTVVVDLPESGALVQIAMIATTGEREIIHPPGWVHSPNPYSYAVSSGDLVFLSGLVPRRGRDNSAIAGDIEVQTRAIIDNAAQVLAAAGLSLAHIVAARVYLTDASVFAGMNRAYAEAFGGSPPARATVVCGLAGPDFQVEITFVASRGLREVIGTPPPGIPISPAVRTSDLVFVSGMLGNTPETRGNVAAQSREMFARIDRTLTAAGVTAADVVEAAVYAPDIVGALPDVDREYQALFGAAPARTDVGAKLVAGDGLVEVMVTAVRP